MLNELLKKIKTKESTQNKLSDLYLQKKELEENVKKQRKILRKETDDVEKLEYLNLSSFFYEITGTKDKKLSKEKEEAYQAKLKYDSFVYQLNAILKDISYFENILKDINECEIQYQELFTSKLNDLKLIDPTVNKLEHNLITSQNLIKEMEEAIHIGEIALHTSNKIIRKLDSAQSWSKYDLIGGSAFADLSKYKHLDDAQNLINELQSQLSRFKIELLDVKVDFTVKIEIEAFLRVADYWFDNVFTDYIVLDRIKKAITQIKNTHHSISAVLSELRVLHSNEKTNETQIKEKLDKIVLESE